MKLDIKSILILILLGFTLIFGYKWYYGTDNNDYKNKIKELRDSNDLLEKQRDSIRVRLVNLKNDLDILKDKEELLNSEIDNMRIEIEKAKANSNKSKSELDKLKSELKETRKRIDYLKDNPPNRTGDDLIRSLKNNLKR